MRKTNVFGKKINPSRPLYLLILVFIITLGSYLTILYISNMTIAELRQEQSQLQQDINSLLIEQQSIDYQTLEQLLPYLPNEFDQSIVYNELILVRDMSSLSEADNYSSSFTVDTDSPFEDNTPPDLRFVKITIHMTISDYTLLFDYLDNLILMDRLYYIDSVDANILVDDSSMVELIIYTFYME